MAWSLLDALPSAQSDEVMRLARRRTFEAGDVIFHEADPADSIHVIQSGRVAFLVSTSDGNELMFGVSGPDEFFGELALISADGLRSATARALESTQTLSIHRQDFERLRQQSPAVSELLMSILAERVRLLSSRLEEALFVPAEERVLRRLLAVARAYGAGANGSGTTVPLSQEQLASLAGTSRATVNRVLRQEQKLGSLKLGRQRVTILEPRRLAARARI